MASVSNFIYTSNVSVVTEREASLIRVTADSLWLTLSRDEAVQLAVDLLNAAEAAPVDAEVSV